MPDQMIDLRLSRRDVGRLLNGVRERRRKLDRGIEKFGADFDPKLGSNIAESHQAFTALEKALKEAMNNVD